MLFKPSQSSFTNPMTTTGDLIYSSDNSGTAARLGVGSNGQGLVLTAGVPTWANVAAAFNYTSQSTTYAAAINDYILASGSSFVITLPTAASVAGKLIGIQHAGTSLTQVYTLNTTSSQTIGGVASGAYALYTNRESLILFSDGANWQILTHPTISVPAAYTPTTTGLSATVPTNISFFWQRNANRCKVWGSLTTGTLQATAFSITLPGSSPIDTNYVSIANTLANPGPRWGTIQSQGTNVYAAVISATGTSTTLLYSGSIPSGATPLTQVATASTAGSPFAPSSISHFEFEYPVSGWQP